MILRPLAVRQASRAALSAAPRVARRGLASDVDILERTVENSLKEVKSVESGINSAGPESVPTIDPETHQTAVPRNFPSEVAADYAAFLHHQSTIHQIGSRNPSPYQPHTLITNPPRPSEVTLELLLASQAHLGHSTSVWNPANARYIFGIRQGIHIISLDATAAHLRRAAKIVTEVTRKGGLVFFVGTRAGQDKCVIQAAKLAKGCHLFERWKPGSITNGQQLLAGCELKVVDEFDNEVEGYEDQMDNLPVAKPDLVVCLNPMDNYVLLQECSQNNIPTIGIIDTDANPTWVTYPIPANDDSLRCTQVIAGVLGRAGEEGQRLRLEAAARGEVTYKFHTRLEDPLGEGKAEAEG